MSNVECRMWKDGAAVAFRVRRCSGIRHSTFGIRRSSSGVGLVELLLALAITAMLLTATMAALHASFRAYASAAESASTQSSARLATHRLLALVRTSTAHGPLQADASEDPPVTIDGDTVTSHYIELIDAQNRYTKVEFRPALQELWVTSQPVGGGTAISQPILSGVTAARFLCKRRKDKDGVYVLQRATMDLTVSPATDNTLAIEAGNTPPIRVIASTMPRKLD